MMYPVTPPEVCGFFNVERAQLIAQESDVVGDPHGSETYWYNRSDVVDDAGAVMLRDIELSLLPESPKPTHGVFYAYEPASNSPDRFWHVYGKDMMIRYTGNSTQFIGGEVDLTPIEESFTGERLEKYAQQPNGAYQMLIDRMDILDLCVDQSLVKGYAHIIEPVEPGDVLGIGRDTVQRSFSPSGTQPQARLLMTLHLGSTSPNSL